MERIEKQFDPMTSKIFKDNNGYTQLHFAAKVGDLETCKKFVHLLKEKDCNGRTAMHIASIKGNYDIVEYFFETDKSVLKETDVEGWTPLLIAARNGHAKICELLMTEGYSEKDNDGDTALHLAMSTGINGSNYEVCKLFVGLKKEKNKSEQTPIVMAIGKGYKDVVELLTSKEDHMENLKTEVEVLQKQIDKVKLLAEKI